MWCCYDTIKYRAQSSVCHAQGKPYGMKHSCIWVCRLYSVKHSRRFRTFLGKYWVSRLVPSTLWVIPKIGQAVQVRVYSWSGPLGFKRIMFPPYKMREYLSTHDCSTLSTGQKPFPLPNTWVTVIISLVQWIEQSARDAFRHKNQW